MRAAVCVARYTAGVSEAAVRLTTVRSVLSIVIGVFVHDLSLDVGGTGDVRYGTTYQVISVGQRFIVIVVVEFKERL